MTIKTPSRSAWARTALVQATFLTLLCGVAGEARAQFNPPLPACTGSAGDYEGDLHASAPGFLCDVNNTNGQVKIDVIFQGDLASVFGESSLAKLEGLSFDSLGRFGGERTSTANNSLLKVDGQMNVLSTRCEWVGNYSITTANLPVNKTYHGTFSAQTGEYPGGLNPLGNLGSACGTGSSCAPTGLLTMMALMTGMRGLRSAKKRRPQN